MTGALALKLCALIPEGEGLQPRTNPSPCHHCPYPGRSIGVPPGAVLEGGTLTFFKDSKTQLLGGLVSPRPPEQGPPHLLLTPEACQSGLVRRLGLRLWNEGPGAGPWQGR